MKRIYGAKRPKVAPVHPGELMREILEEHVKMPVAEAARRIGVSRVSLHAVLSGRSAVTPDMALRFGRLVGASPEAYVNMQVGYDMWHAQERLAKELEAIKPAA